MMRVCAADFDANGQVEAVDLTGYLIAYQAGTAAADVDDGSGTGFLRRNNLTSSNPVVRLGKANAAGIFFLTICRIPVRPFD
jgi:hypothetical protein